MAFFRSLKGRLTIITGVAIVVTGTVVLLFGFFIARSTMRSQTYATMEGVVKRARGSVEATVGLLADSSTAIAADSGIQADMTGYEAGAVDTGVLEADLSAMMAGYVHLPGLIGSVALATPDGQVVVSVNGPTTGKAPKKVPAQLGRHVADGVPAFGFRVRSGEFIVDTASRILDPGGDRLVGMVYLSGAGGSLQRQLSDTSGLGTSGRMMLSEREGKRVKVAAFAGGNPDSERVAITYVSGKEGTPPVRAADGESGEGEYTMGKTGVVTAYDFIPGISWGITATSDASQAFAPIYRLRNVMIIVVVVLLFGGSALAYMIARSITRPITELQEGVKALASGELSTRVVIHDGLEVTALADEFNEMAIRLMELYNTLEGKVEERTAELKEANERLMILDDLKSDFVSTASHELRGPLASMKMGVATVGNEMVGPLNDEQKQMLEIAERNIDRLTRLTGDLLDLTKIEAEQLDLVLDRCDILELAGEVAVTDEPVARAKGLDILVESTRGPVAARCDRDRIHQVIQNLVSNAVKFTDKGSVTITVDHVEGGAGAGEGREAPVGCIEVCVRDTGSGVPPECLESIFEKWSQAHSDTRSEKRGTGLGLAISRGIVEAHGGSISVASEVGKGSTFCFRIPVHGPDA